MNDDFLNRLRKPPRREFTLKLYERISATGHSRRPAIRSRRVLRPVLATGALALLLLSAVLSVPSARAYVAEQVRQIGAIIFRPAETGSHSSELAATEPPPTIPAPGDTDPVENATGLEDASRLAGFTVLAPGYLPDGYNVAALWSIDRRESGIYVVSTFHNAATNQFLVLNQNRYAPGASFEQTYGENEQVTDVTVGGQAGVWITGRYMTDPTVHGPVPDGEPELFVTQWLVWQEGEITYVLFGNGLEQAEMIAIAESLDS